MLLLFSHETAEVRDRQKKTSLTTNRATPLVKCTSSIYPIGMQINNIFQALAVESLSKQRESQSTTTTTTKIQQSPQTSEMEQVNNQGVRTQ